MGNKKRKPKASLSPLQENRFLKITLFLMVVAIAWIVFAPGNGILALLNQRAELKSIEQETQELTMENEGLRAEIDRIENDEEYLEEISRRDHGMVKENEMLFEFPVKKKPAETK